MTQIDRRSFLAASGAVVTLQSGQMYEPAWRTRTSAPWAVQEIYCAPWRGRIVIAGGLRAATRGIEIEDRCGIYDPATDRWSEGPNLPSARHHPMLIAHDDAVYALGGYGRSEAGDWTAMTEVWRMGDSGWARAGTMPEPQGEAVGLAHGGRLHLIGGRSPAGGANGGWNDQADVATHRVLDPAASGWYEARPAPMARNSAAGAVLNGALWVAGGRTVRGGGTGQLDRYDPGEDRWDTLAPIPPSTAAGHQVGGGLAMVALGTRLVAFGGEWFAPGGGGVFRETWLYDPATDVWIAGPDMRTPRHGLAAAAAEGVVYAIAGGAVVSGGQAVGTVEALRL